MTFGDLIAIALFTPFGWIGMLILAIIIQSLRK